MSPAEEELALHYHLGMAITEWAQVEWSLLIVGLTATHDRSQIALGYLSIENFRSKLEFIDAVLKIPLLANNSHKQRWVVLYDRIKRSSARRNKLVHRNLWSDGAQKPGHRVALIDWLSPRVATRRKKDDSKKPKIKDAIYLRDVVAIRQEFTYLAGALKHFAQLISDAESAQHPEFAEPPARPPTIQTISNQIRAILEPPPKPSLMSRAKLAVAKKSAGQKEKP